MLTRRVNLKNSLKLQKEVLEYWKYLISTFNQYQNFLKAAGKFFEDIIMTSRRQKSEIPDFYSNVVGFSKISYEEFQDKMERLPLNVPKFKLILLNNDAFSPEDRIEIRSSIIWHKDALRELGVSVKFAPRGTDEWLQA